MAAQFTLTNAREERCDRLWIARAINSLPVPVSPMMRTVESVGATFVTLESTPRNAREAPTISSNIDVLSISSRRATFSFWTFSSACFRSSMSVAVVYHRMMAPRSSRNGLERIRNQRYCPSFRSSRASASHQAPLESARWRTSSTPARSSG